MFLFSRGKLPKLIHRLGYNVKDHKVESEVPAKRKRADSKLSNIDANDSMSSESSNSETKPIPNTRHKLRRTKKHENLRDEWKKYHNNFVPIIPSESSESAINNSIKSSAISAIDDKAITIQQSSLDYNGIKYSIKDKINKNNYIKIDSNNKESKGSDRHVAKKRRLFSFIQL